MDHILQRVVGSSRISLLDGFSGYNQILVQPEDQPKTTFTTPWDTFMYVKMPFDLMNAGATFQIAMDIAFCWVLKSAFQNSYLSQINYQPGQVLLFRECTQYVHAIIPESNVS